LQQVLTLLLEAYATLWVAGLALGVAFAVFRSVDLSYGIYIYGWPLAQFLVWRFPGISTGTMAVLSLSLAILVAFASWTLVEKPALRLKHRWKRIAPVFGPVPIVTDAVRPKSAPPIQQ
jgi:peptidoglycan/LPS O-acetylase OafA/YrhL